MSWAHHALDHSPQVSPHSSQQRRFAEVPRIPDRPVSGWRRSPCLVLAMNELWSFTWEAGPDAGGTTVLAHGSHIIGRASGASVHCDDASIEPHQVLAEIGA